MSEDWWSKKENIEKLIQMLLDEKTRIFVTRNRPLSRRLLVLSRLAVANGIQFVSDAYTLLQQESYAHSVALSIFALEEFGKAAYSYYAHKGWTRMDELHKYLRDHRRKQAVLESLELGALLKEESERISKTGSFVSIENIMEIVRVNPREKLWDSMDKFRTMALYVDCENPDTILNFDERIALTFLSLALQWGKILAKVLSRKPSTLGG